jgi:hypothetical protein
MIFSELDMVLNLMMLSEVDLPTLLDWLVALNLDDL